jgi:hypothetical protein
VGRLSIPLGAFVAVFVAALALIAPGARAQRPDPHAGLAPPPDRPLHVRIALADAAAVGTVESVEAGRIRVRHAVPVFGDVASDFELKRAPSHPPPLEAGDRALLLLRGARTPYLLVDEGREIQAIADPDGEALWREAVRAARSRPGADLPELYRAWLDRGPDPLRRAAVIGLGDREASFAPVAPEIADRLVQLAIDPRADTDLRRMAARAAGESEAGRRALWHRLPGGVGADPQVLAYALRIGAVAGGPAAAAALRRALADPRVEIRLTAIRLAPLFLDRAGVEDALEGLAGEDPDPGVRTAAGRALGRAQPPD